MIRGKSDAELDIIWEVQKWMTMPREWRVRTSYYDEATGVTKRYWRDFSMDDPYDPVQNENKEEYERRLEGVKKLIRKQIEREFFTVKKEPKNDAVPPDAGESGQGSGDKPAG